MYLVFVSFCLILIRKEEVGKARDRSYAELFLGRLSNFLKDLARTKLIIKNTTIARMNSRSKRLNSATASREERPEERPKAISMRTRTELAMAARDTGQNFLNFIFTQPTENIIAKVDDGKNLERNIHLSELVWIFCSKSSWRGMCRRRKLPIFVSRNLFPSQYQAKSPLISAAKIKRTIPSRALALKFSWKANQRAAKETGLPMSIIEKKVIGYTKRGWAAMSGAKNP